MDGQKQPDQPVSTDAPDKQPRHSFMDIRGPKPEAKPAAPDTKAAETPIAPEPATTPAADAPKENLPADMPDLALAPSEEQADGSDNPAQTLNEPKNKKPPKAPKAVKPPKAPRQPGVGFAIFATIIIVLGLAALATYAYLRTNNITLF